MVEILEKAFAEVQKLSPEDQEWFAHLMLEELSNRADYEYIFLSYSSRHRYVTSQIKHWIETNSSYRAWWDDGLTPTKDWKNDLKDKVENCTIFAFLLTPESVKSLYCLNEYNLAAQNGKPFIPILLHPEAKLACPDKIKAKQIVDFTGDIAKAEDDVRDMLKHLDRIGRLSKEDIVEPFLAAYHLDEIVEDASKILRQIYRRYVLHNHILTEQDLLSEQQKLQEIEWLLQDVYPEANRTDQIKRILKAMEENRQALGKYFKDENRAAFRVSMNSLLMNFSQIIWQ